ncbi:hypothetical protein NECAME_06865 [Necator americanus]|uniref:Uncharacterized protein n=1 Tax=Necator americanus TaxID=51031 RepID=W2TTT4_NECAM|nr:hypothetical protein NECAME_06865 [Necator americanus]ETN84462.1 hypothetical protein NECAME_06865 [Necator americanus]
MDEVIHKSSTVNNNDRLAGGGRCGGPVQKRSGRLLIEAVCEMTELRHRKDCFLLEEPAEVHRPIWSGNRDRG